MKALRAKTGNELIHLHAVQAAAEFPRDIECGEVHFMWFQST